MKAIITTFCICLFFITSNLCGQTNFKWGKQFGSNKEDGSVTIASDQAGNVFIAGYTLGVLSTQNFGKNDAFIQKLDSIGSIAWTNQFGTIEDDRISAIVTDKTGNIYVTGYTKGVLGDKNSGVEDIFVAKLDNLGNIKWTKQFGTDKKDVANGISIDSSGDIYVVGETSGLFGESALGGIDGFVLKLDNDGIKKGIRQFGTALQETCSAIAIDAAKNIYVSGSTFGNLGATNLGKSDAYVAIFNDEIIQTKAIQFGTISNDSYIKVALDKAGNIYVGGSTGGNFVGIQLGQGDSFLAKFNKLGELLWNTQFGTGNWDGIHGILIDEQLTDNVIVSGCQNWPSCQAFIREFRNDGKLVGVQNFAINEVGKGSCGRTTTIDNKGNIYHTGLTTEKLFANALGENDIFVLKLALSANSTRPYVNSSIVSPVAYKDKQFSYTFPDTIFNSDKGRSNFAYSASMSNGDKLPSWLTFDPKTRTFSGTPTTVQVCELKMLAIDNTNSVASCIFSIEVKTALSSVGMKSKDVFQIFPNPSNGVFELKFGSKPFKEVLVKISDIQGRYFFVEKYENLNATTVDLSGNPKGIYFVKLFLDGEMHSRKVYLE